MTETIRNSHGQPSYSFHSVFPLFKGTVPWWWFYTKLHPGIYPYKTNLFYIIINSKKVQKICLDKTQQAFVISVNKEVIFTAWGVSVTDSCMLKVNKMSQVWIPIYLYMYILGVPVSSTNKTDRHDITEILLKVVLNLITLTLYFFLSHSNYLRYNLTLVILI